jgi:type IV secretion system protein VirD4
MWGGAGKTPTVSISEQPRRLLLPQEVEELGPTRMILFYEGLRPVLAHRIRYFHDRFFAKRELPPPPVPKLRVDRSSHITTTAQVATRDEDEDTLGTDPGSLTNATSQGVGSALKKEARGVLGGDLKLDDFSFDFDDVEIPTEKLSDEDMKRRVDEFMARILD